MGSFLALAAAAPLEDTAEVAAAKEAPAPVHVLPEPAPLVAAPVAPIVAAPAIAYAGLHHAAYPYAINHLGYAGYAGYPYHAGVLGCPYAGLPLVAAAAPAAAE